MREIKARKTKDEQLPANLLFSSTPPIGGDETAVLVVGNKEKVLPQPAAEAGLVGHLTSALLWNSKEKDLHRAAA